MSRTDGRTAAHSSPFENLERLRLQFHRLVPSRPLEDLRAMRAFICERRMAMSTGHSSLPIMSEAIAGRQIPGSWMAHPEAAHIYRLLRRLARSDVIAAPVILGKETLCDPSLGPTLQRVASDARRRRAALEALPSLAHQLLEAVERRGKLRMDQWTASTPAGRSARTLLERQLLVCSAGLHTNCGYHTSLVKPWASSTIAQRFATAARRISLEQAIDQLLLAAVHAAVIAPDTEVRRWLVTGRARIDDLLTERQLIQIPGPRRRYLTTMACYRQTVQSAQHR